ncbi:MAG: hypothetical protein JWR19_1774 [Pedosphaera sp.]|nr:hypothetical protein [Pedosphaera sp.]
MILSSDELQILDYLKSWNGKFVSMVEICRRAGGRQKFKETPHWGKALMARLIESELAEVNERGHYRIKPEGEISLAEATGVVIDENYFPEPEEADGKTERWISPHIAKILKESGKKFGDGAAGI